MNHCITFDLRCLVASVCVAVCAIPTQADNARQEFGAKERSPASLIGILYDLKQTQERSKTGMTVKLYSQVVDEFLAKKMDDSVLDKFYRVTQPLYTTQLYIPIMDAKEAPKAFSVEKTVSPAMWLIHYKGQAVPPETGRFRFIGYADDWLAVAVNGKIALVAARQDVKLIQTRWESPEKAGMRVGNGNLKVGDWIDFKNGIPFDIDVVIGERPGGKFGAFLMIQKEGGVYEMTPDGQFPILPIFQVAPRKVKATNTNAGPPFSANASVWIALP